jgi:hypothetical protein
MGQFLITKRLACKNKNEANSKMQNSSEVIDFWFVEHGQKVSYSPIIGQYPA